MSVSFVPLVSRLIQSNTPFSVILKGVAHGELVPCLWEWDNQLIVNIPGEDDNGKAYVNPADIAVVVVNA